jgi:nucleotide-binding universal stress UspA family protein
MRDKRNGFLRRILVGYDGSSSSEKALESALSMANSMDSTVEIIAVVRPSEPATSPDLPADLDDARAVFEKALRKIAQGAMGDGLRIETDVLVGHPVQQIIQRAEKSRADLIVLGSRGTSTFKELALGSISERVLASAHCPVLITR